MTCSIIGILAAILLLIINRDVLRTQSRQPAAVMLWTRYVVTCLENDNRFGAILSRAGRLFPGFEILVVAVNFFCPILFWFDGRPMAGLNVPVQTRGGGAAL